MLISNSLAMNTKYLYLSACFLLIHFGAFAQLDDDSSFDFNIVKDQIEQLLSSQEGDGSGETEFKDNSIYDIIEAYFNHPLDINRATAEELKELRFLSDLQINGIIQHRINNGNFIALYELQSIPSLDLATIKALLPFVRLNKNVDDFNVPIHKMLYKGKNTIYARVDRVLEKKRGFKIEEGQEKPKYLGDRNRYLFRYRHQYDTRLSYGFLLENDAGEEFFKGSNKGFPGFDFATFHFFMKDYNKYIKGIALGDFAVNMGQGLIQFDGFGSGKGAYVMDLKKLGRPLRPYTSSSEIFYKRGAALNLTFGKHFEIMTFGSYRNRDANISIAEETNDGFGEVQIGNILEISSIQTSGLHRTEAEIKDKNAIKHLNVGGTIKYKGDNWHIAANATLDKLNTKLQRTIKPYNQFGFNGDALKNASLDYSFIYSNINFFGETAMSDNGALATLNGLIVGVDRRVAVSFLHRYYEKNYQALFSNSFAETSNTNNEHGLYMGLEVKPNKHWQFSGYLDIFKHQWLRYGADAPSMGKEYLGRLTYKRKRKMQVYLQFKEEYKERNISSALQSTPATELYNQKKSTLRLHIENRITKSLTLRNRAEATWFDNGYEPTTTGYMLLQDIIYKPIGFPLSFTARYALFDVETSNNRIYAYENDILGAFSIPGYNNKGSRFYINLRYKGIRKMTMEFRYARTIYANQETFGDGLEKINGNKRSDIKVQIKYSF